MQRNYSVIFQGSTFGKLKKTNNFMMRGFLMELLRNKFQLCLRIFKLKVKSAFASSLKVKSKIQRHFTHNSAFSEKIKRHNDKNNSPLFVSFFPAFNFQRGTSCLSTLNLRNPFPNNDKNLRHHIGLRRFER